MNFKPGYLLGMALQTIPEPRKIAREIQALRYPRAILWQTFALFLILSTGIGITASVLFPPGPEFEGSLLADPIRMGIIEGSILVITIFAIYWVGQAFGGKGRFDEAILTILWLQFIALIVQVVVVVLALFAANLAMMVNVGGIVLTFWVLSHFITEMHGFRSVGLVFAIILLTLMGVIIGLAVIMAIIGVGTISTGGL